MELFEEEVVKKKDKSTKSIIILIVALIVILAMVAVGLLLYISQLQAQQLKIYVDGDPSTLQEDVFHFAEDGTLYVSIKDFAPTAGYTYYNGGYKQYTEDTSMCNVVSSYEVASFESNSEEFRKILIGGTEDNQYFKASKPVTMINGKLYASEDAIEKAFNVSLTYTAENNTISIVTLKYLVTTITGKYLNSALVGNTTADFSIQKAILYNYVVTVNPTSRLYGVSTIGSDGNLVELIGDKYSKIEFVETSQDFIVVTQDNKKGLITNDGITRIRPEYDELRQIDNEYNLYLIRVGSQYGVINKSGKYIVYPEFEEIGVDATLYPRNTIKNPYLLYDNCILVKKDKKWGMIDKNGKVLRNLEYDSIGCTTSTQRDTSTNNLMLVEDYEGIVVCKEKQYGLINSLGEELLPCALQDMYSITNSGKDTLYMTYMNQQIEMLGYMKDNGIVKVNTRKKKDNTETTNTVTEENTTNTTTEQENTTNTQTDGQTAGETQAPEQEQPQQQSQTQQPQDNGQTNPVQTDSNAGQQQANPL